MADLIYDFFRNILIGSNSSISGADTLAILLTWSTIVIFFALGIKLVCWVFGVPFNGVGIGGRYGRRRN